MSEYYDVWRLFLRDGYDEEPVVFDGRQGWELFDMSDGLLTFKREVYDEDEELVSMDCIVYPLDRLERMTINSRRRDFDLGN